MTDGNHEGEVNISEWIANAIAQTGCKVVYGGHGGALVPLVNAICNHPQLTWICARNEHDAATMASAHAKMTGGLGVVVATSGPGATGLTTGLLEATMDRVPLLALTGMKPTAQLGYAEFQDVNQSRLFAGGGIEWSKDVSSHYSVIPLLRDAVATAVTRRTCVHLAIPVDIQAAPSPLPLKDFCASHVELRFQENYGVLDPDLLDATARMLVGSTETRMCPRNILAVGLRAVPTDKETDMNNILLGLAEALNAPVLTRLHAKGVVDENHPLSFGVIGVHGSPGLKSAASLISTSDCVVAIGVEDETLLACNMAGLQIRKIVEIEPNAICVNTRFNAEHTIVGNIAAICQELTKRVLELIAVKHGDHPPHRTDGNTRQEGMSEEQVRSMWDYMAYRSPDSRKQLEEQGYVSQSRLTPSEKDDKDLLDDTDALWDHIHNKKWAGLLKIKEYMQSPRFVCADENEGYKFCHPAAVLKALSMARSDKKVDPVTREAVITVDVGDVTLWASLCLSLQGGSRTLYSEHLGTMGYALCAGIAGIFAQPGPAAAVVLAGDGGFQMSLQELATFQQMKRPGDKLICFVFDNELLGRVFFGFDNAYGCEMKGPDYVALAKAYGGDGILLEKTEDAEKIVRQALDSNTEGLFLVHVLVDPKLKADMASFHDTSIEIMKSG